MVNRWFFLFFIFIVYSEPALCKLRVSGLFADNMVLQRDEPIFVQGTATPGDKVSVAFHLSSVSCKVNEKGCWQVRLPAEKAGGPYLLAVWTEEETLSFKNVLVGDVWFASGQSNMEHPIEGWEWLPNSSIYRCEEELVDSDYPEIRLFTVPKYPASIEVEEVPIKEWKIPEPESLRGFSSTAWFFAKALYKKLQVPVGIINCSWAGTSIKAWESKEVLNEFKDSLNFKGTPPIPDRDKVVEALRANQQRRCQISIPREGQVREIGLLPTVAWTPFDLKKIPASSEVFWLKKEIDLPERYAKEPLFLSLGLLNRQSIIYFNGREIGEYMYPEPTIALIPKSCICPGRNELLVRLAQPFGPPSVKGDKSLFFMSTRDAGFREDLSEGWSITVQDSIPKPDAEYQNYPGALFNGMVHPCLEYNVKGVIWYQGENDVWKPELYAEMFRALILDWRKKWKKEDLPFLYVQISLLPEIDPEAGEPPYQLFREKQCVALPNTGMAYSLDIGDPYDVHPRNKKVVGERLAEQAFRIVYEIK